MADTHHYVTEYDLLVTVLVYSRWLDRRMIHNSGLDITAQYRWSGETGSYVDTIYGSLIWNWIYLGSTAADMYGVFSTFQCINLLPL